MRIKIELSDELSATVKELAKKRDSSISEVIRRAISLENFFDQELAEGTKVLLKSKGSDNLQEVILR
jgi:predicted transcriptional regulator